MEKTRCFYNCNFVTWQCFVIEMVSHWLAFTYKKQLNFLLVNTHFPIFHGRMKNEILLFAVFLLCWMNIKLWTFKQATKMLQASTPSGHVKAFGIIFVAIWIRKVIFCRFYNNLVTQPYQKRTLVHCTVHTYNIYTDWQVGCPKQ